MSPYQGQPVVYTLSELDAEQIKGRRAELGLGGNVPAAGDQCPAFIVKLWNPTLANLTVLLDGSDTFWATSRNPGTGPGAWFIPTASA